MHDPAFRSIRRRLAGMTLALLVGLLAGCSGGNLDRILGRDGGDASVDTASARGDADAACIGAVTGRVSVRPAG